ncbi:hypothetical protein JMJ77_0009902 [Colletotrichum scovillei]|uniref:Uncharacterized protein n=1 Tax=Colletotrichum scovillei TaxID=1209932 RepID=A0A9P7U5M5_9PEZI|nr:hypothetical protein JMJ78_0000022 [Colletotrichum scovillei]KAG7040348.1 hypothetical protein JMJ77_0009902 [Colletotrichum scovillei]KAG7060397.1 hypothetical protein JMJ76_0000834 [Colletotrichum scovillei]
MTNTHSYASLPESLQSYLKPDFSASSPHSYNTISLTCILFSHRILFVCLTAFDDTINSAKIANDIQPNSIPISFFFKGDAIGIAPQLLVNVKTSIPILNALPLSSGKSPLLLPIPTTLS